MRPLIFWWLLLLQAAVFVSADAQTTDGAEGRNDVDGETVAARQSLLTEVDPGRDNGRDAREPGADLVDAAMAELGKLSQAHHHRRRKRPSVFGTVLRYALRVVPSFRISAPPQDTPKKAISGPLLDAVKLLEESSHKNNSDALYLLAQFNFYGNYSHPKNFLAAFEYYQRLASLNGNGSALYMLGLMYSTGVGGAVERDQARALLYYTFAASGGHTRAEMAVAFRHHMGISTQRSCETAIKYYKRVADKAMAWYRSGPPGGQGWVVEAYRIADETGGIYGEGASVSSSGMNAIRASPSSDAYASIDDVIEYLDLLSQKGDFKASLNLGRLYYEGQRGLERDLDLARKYLMSVVHLYWKKGGRVAENFKQGLDSTAGKAAGIIGRMYLRGDGVEQNFDRAQFWFNRGNSNGDAQSRYGLGLMHLYGYGVPKNIARATELFKTAADQDFGPAQIELGTLHLDQGGPDDPAIANLYFEKAVKFGLLEAYYYLAEMTRSGIGRDKSCSSALGFYKVVSEKAEPLVSSWAEANVAYEDGDYELALLDYLSAAEQGYERAQNNVAYLLDPEQSMLPIPTWLWRRGQRPAVLQNPSLALIYWTRSSRQGNIDSLVKMGDYYLHGVGTEPDVDKAVQCYNGASEYHQSAQALYNLGWMHENGVGLTQDFHLAKRYYDLALDTNMEAYLPVTLSLLKLRARSAWNTFTHGRINSIQDEPPPVKDWSLSEWIANFMQDDHYYDDPGYDDMFDDTMPGGDPGLGEMDGGIFESLVILGLAAALVFLMFYRNYRQEAARRAEEARRRQQGGQVVGQNQNPAPPVPAPAPVERGFFPQPGDPDAGQWAAGGIGH